MILLSVHNLQYNAAQQCCRTAAFLNQSSWSEDPRFLCSACTGVLRHPFLPRCLFLIILFSQSFLFKLSVIFFSRIDNFCFFGINMFFRFYFTKAWKIFPQDSTDSETQFIWLILLFQVRPILDPFPWEKFSFHLLASFSSLKLSLKFKTVVIVNHRFTERLMMGGTSGGHLIQAPCSSRVTESQLPRTTSRWLLNIFKSGESTMSLGHLSQCLVSLTVKMCFLMFRESILCFSLCPFNCQSLHHRRLSDGFPGLVV